MKELFGKSMEVLLEHYDPTTGRRRSVIPFDQVIRPTLILTDAPVSDRIQLPRGRLLHGQPAALSLSLVHSTAGMLFLARQRGPSMDTLPLPVKSFS